MITVLSSDHGTAVITLRGELDLFTAEAVDRALATALAGGPRSMVIDLYDVDFLDMAVLGVLVRGRDAPPPRGVTLHVVGAHDIVRRVFELTGTERLMADWWPDIPR